MRAALYIGMALLTAVLYGQQVQVNESVFVQLNASTLVTGETLRFHVFCVQTDRHVPSTASKLVYVQLIDRDRKIVFSQKRWLEQAGADGDFFIPTTLATGRYKLVAFTRWMLCASRTNFFETDVAIINPFVGGALTGKVSQEDFSRMQPTSGHSIATNKTDYSTREQVILRTDLPAGRYTASVRKIDALPAIPMPDVMRFSAMPAQTITVEEQKLPELRGELIGGKIQSSNQPLAHQPVALSIAGNPPVFKIADTDAQGRFVFLVDQPHRSGEMVVQVLGDKADGYTVSLDPAPEPDLSGLKFLSLVLRPDQQTLIERRAVAAQVENAYFERKKDSVIAVADSPVFFESVQKDYVLDDYTRFPTLRETITEILAEANYRKHDGHYRIGLKDYGNDLAVYGAPLVLVDGLPVADHDVLFNWPMGEVYKISIVNKPYVLGPKMYGGVINFVSKEQEFRPMPKGGFTKVQWNAPSNRKSYFAPDYPKDRQPRIPDYRQQLLWLPELDPTQMTDFYTGDLEGEFEVIVQGFDKFGKPVYERSTFTVANQ